MKRKPRKYSSTTYRPFSLYFSKKCTKNVFVKQFIAHVWKVNKMFGSNKWIFFLHYLVKIRTTYQMCVQLLIFLMCVSRYENRERLWAKCFVNNLHFSSTYIIEYYIATYMLAFTFVFAWTILFYKWITLFIFVRDNYESIW